MYPEILFYFFSSTYLYPLQLLKCYHNACNFILRSSWVTHSYQIIYESRIASRLVPLIVLCLYTSSILGLKVSHLNLSHILSKTTSIYEELQVFPGRTSCLLLCCCTTFAHPSIWAFLCYAVITSPGVLTTSEHLEHLQYTLYSPHQAEFWVAT